MVLITHKNCFRCMYVWIWIRLSDADVAVKVTRRLSDGFVAVKVTSRKKKKDIEAHWPRFDEGRADFETRKCSGIKADFFIRIHSSTS